LPQPKHIKAEKLNASAWSNIKAEETEKPGDKTEGPQAQTNMVKLVASTWSNIKAEKTKNPRDHTEGQQAQEKMTPARITIPKHLMSMPDAVCTISSCMELHRLQGRQQQSAV
jgi:hypothetical protein